MRYHHIIIGAGVIGSATAYHWPDKNPVVESIANISWVGGSSGSGIMKADAIGRVTAGHVLDENEVTLADGSELRVSALSLREREVSREEFII